MSSPRYDTLNRVVKQWDAITGVNDTVTLTYDALFVTRVQAPGNQLYKFTTNALGWPTERYDAYDTTNALTFQYDTAGRLVYWTNLRGQEIDLTYDVLDRVLTRTGAGTVADTFSYSLDGTIMRGTRTGVSVDSTVMTVGGLPSSIVRWMGGKRFEIDYSYDQPYPGSLRTVTITDNAGINFSQETDAIHAVPFGVDSLTLTGGDGSGVTTITKGPDQLPTGIQFSGGGSHLQPIYSARHQLISEDVRALTISSIVARSTLFDSLGRVVQSWGNPDPTTSKQLVRSFVYDTVGQLLKVNLALDSSCVLVQDTLVFGDHFTCLQSVAENSQDSATSYDAAGNRNFPGATYSPRGNRLLTGPTGVTYTYDRDGNMATRQHGGLTDAFYWGPTGQLDSVISGTLHHWYEYNSFGQLVRRQTAIGTGAYAVDRYFLWDGSQLLAELSGAMTRIAQYVYHGTDTPFALITDSASGTSLVRHYYQDPNAGNLTAVLGDSMSIYQITRYYAWGKQYQRPANALADTNRLGWKGLMYEGDATQLYYMRNRWYDPAVGRFVSQDPIGIAGGMNLYAFAHNDPINGRDPSGACAYFDTETGRKRNALTDQILTASDGQQFTCTGDGLDDPWATNIAGTTTTADGSGSGWWDDGFWGFGDNAGGPSLPPITGGFPIQTAGGGTPSMNPASKPSVSTGSNLLSARCVSAVGGLGIAGLNTVAWFTGAGEAAFAVTGAAKLGAVGRSILTYAAGEATTGKLVLSGSETAFTGYAFNEPFNTMAKIQAVAELFPVLDIISTGYTVKKSCF